MKVKDQATHFLGDGRTATSRRRVLGAASVFVVALTALQVAASSPTAAAVRRPLGPGTVWDSVFTLAQAGRGESTYKASCGSCHGDSLTGIDDAPPLTGPGFHKNWDGNALSSLFNKISNDMPSDNPGTLTKPQVAEVIAFVLKYNLYPAGAVDLTAAVDSLATIRIIAKP